MRDSQAADVLSLRRHNLSLVLHHLRDQGQSSRIQVSADTGLGAGAVTSLVGELIDYGLVEEAGVRGTGSAGRPRRLLTLRGRSVAAVGVRFDAESVAVRVTDLAERERHHERGPHKLRGASAEEVAGVVAERVERAVADAVAVPVVVAVPGWTDQGLVTSPTLGWRGVPLLAALRARLGPGVGPLSLANDANLGTWAEYQLLRLSGVRDLIYLEGGIGVGGGFVAGGRQVYGAAGAAGEFGHVVVDAAGPACPCGRRGCLERYASLPVVLGAAGIPAAPGELDAALEELAGRTEHGDPAALAAVDGLAARLRPVIAHARTMLDPRVIVLGGYFGRLAPWLAPMLARDGPHLPPPVLARDGPHLPPPFEVRAAGHARDAALYGATSSAVTALLDDPLLITRPG
ncbi:ROK family protein [Nonomuraea rhizosphaerae]|uniref:ROK family protein n=1 Tax=Nonomuraea rhizosphaerae TaxID=2665663 RepID=UPI001C5D5B47|nr:ROK family protein [Nonomuraea rhizosphaerae]